MKRLSTLLGFSLLVGGCAQVPTTPTESEETPPSTPSSLAPPTFAFAAAAPAAAGSAFVVATAGNDHSCALAASGQAYCWGSNSSGQLGTGSTSGALVPVPVAGGLTFRSLSAGANHTCGVTTGNQGYCWGSAVDGQLGGTAPGTCTNGACALSPVPVSGGRPWRLIDAGGAHTCGIALNGRTYCWGHNVYGALGDGSTIQRVTPVPVAGAPTFTTIAAGTTHSCGITSTGAVYCWGENRFGQLGTSSSQICSSVPCATAPLKVAGLVSFSRVDVGGVHTCAISAANEVYCWGQNRFMQLGDGTTTNHTQPARVATALKFASLSLGLQHSCGVTPTGAAHCWGGGGGGGGGGRLGAGGVPNLGLPLLVAGGIGWSAVTAGSEHSCGVATSGLGYCWGHEDFGELGNGGAQQSTTLVPVAIASLLPPPSAAKVPLTDNGAGNYLGFGGGLYPGGSAAMPAGHHMAGVGKARAVQPLDRAGRPSSTGKYVLVSIGMSNTTHEFCNAVATNGRCGAGTFISQAAADPAVKTGAFVIVDGAASGQTAAFWDSPTDSNYDRVRDTRLAPAGVTEQQVQIVWVKVVNPTPQVSLPSANADAFTLTGLIANIARAVRVRYPNIKLMFLSNRSYGGYATVNLNPEPYAYESGYAVKWVIEAQIKQMAGQGIDARAGNLDLNTVAPWISWGPDLWANGTQPRSDGLVWTRQDFGPDGTHPSTSGVRKAGNLLLRFFKGSPQARCWFVIAGVCN